MKDFMYTCGSCGYMWKKSEAVDGMIKMEKEFNPAFMHEYVNGAKCPRCSKDEIYSKQV